VGGRRRSADDVDWHITFKAEPGTHHRLGKWGILTSAATGFTSITTARRLGTTMVSARPRPPATSRSQQAAPMTGTNGTGILATSSTSGNIDVTTAGGLVSGAGPASPDDQWAGNITALTGTGGVTGTTADGIKTSAATGFTSITTAGCGLGRYQCH